MDDIKLDYNLEEYKDLKIGTLAKIMPFFIINLEDVDEFNKLYQDEIK